MTIGAVIQFITSLIAFLILGTIFWFLPGYLFLRKELRITKLEKLFLGLIVGFSAYTVVIYAVRLAGLPFWVGFIPFILISVKHLKLLILQFKIKLPKLSKNQKLFIFIALFGALVQSLVLIRSGIYTSNGLQFTQLAFHDSIWHIYLIEELKNNFPPRHAGFAPELVKNYHFLLDLTIASFTKYIPISAFEMYYRIIPFFVSILFSLGVYSLTRRLTKNDAVANIAVLLSLFSGNAAWFVQFFRGPEFRYASDTFMLDQISFMLHNPHAVIVFPLMLAGIIGLDQLKNKFNIKFGLLCILTFGIAIGFKAWGGVLMFVGLTVAAIWSSVINKNHKLWIVWVLTVFLSLTIFLPLYESATAAKPMLLPGWLLKRMVEGPNRYFLPRYFLLEQYYRETNNTLRLIQINLEQSLLFIFGNLWMRLLGVVSLAVYLYKSRNSVAIFISAVAVASLALPLLFNQGRMAYDIVQFGPYSLVLLSIFTAPVFFKIASRFRKLLKITVIAFLLLLTIPSNTQRLKDWMSDDVFTITNQELEIYEYLRKNKLDNSILLLYPSKINIDTAKVVALSQTPTYFSTRTFAQITGENFEERNSSLNQFFFKLNSQEGELFFKENDISHVVLLKSELEKFQADDLHLK